MAYTTIDDPTIYFQNKLYTGNGSTQSITLDGDTDMQPDWVWLKSRSDAYSHILHDSVRGATKELKSNSTNAEGTDSNGLTSFNSDGFSLGTGGSVNNNSSTYVAWNWKAGGSASSNSDGDITSSVSANTTAGFSIMTYTGTGSNNTVGHGLNSAPTYTIIRRRDSARNWFVSVVPYTGDTGYFYLHTNGAGDASGQSFFTAKPTNSVMNLGTDQDANISSGSYIAYNFHDVQGYSKFGKFLGNGDNNGTFIYLGFRPAWVMIKKATGTGNWGINDIKRDINSTYGNDASLYANSDSAETTSSSLNIDLLSNGMKLRSNNSSYNASGETYVYIAFAEAPFTNSSGVPCNAR